MNYYQNGSGMYPLMTYGGFEHSHDVQYPSYSGQLSNYTHHYAVPIQSSTNRFIYVNQNMVQNAQINANLVSNNPQMSGNFSIKNLQMSANFSATNAQMSANFAPMKPQKNPQMKAKKVLINPNFKPSIHINPNFNGKLPVSKMIHVNPVLLNPKKYPPEVTKSTQVETVKSYNVRSDKLKIVKSDYSSPKFISTRNNTKLIRASLVKGRTSCASNLKESNKSLLNTRSKINQITITPKQNLYTRDSRRNSFSFKSKFKIDRRIVIKESSKLGSSIIRNSVSTKFVFITGEKTRYVKINGIIYKRSQNSLVKKVKVAKLNKSLHIQEKQYKLNAKRRTLSPSYKLPKSYKDAYHINKRVSRNVLYRQVRRNSVGTLKKCNIPCTFYQRYGKCSGKDTGKCLKTHNPDQIAICPKFLQGACIETRCLLSHQISEEKMPTCKYFLEGRCSKENCQYLHVKVSPKADICKDFLEGFCKAGKECPKRHQYLCPDYEKNNVCKKVRCPYPHGNMVRDIDLLNKVAKRTICRQTAACKQQSSSKINGDDAAEDVAESDLEKNKRYYSNASAVPPPIATACDKMSVEGEGNSEGEKFITRPRLGALPTFIPFSASPSS